MAACTGCVATDSVAACAGCVATGCVAACLALSRSDRRSSAFSRWGCLRRLRGCLLSAATSSALSRSVSDKTTSFKINAVSSQGLFPTVALY